MGGINLVEVSKTYPGGVLAVDGVSLEIADGEFMVLVGPSGCGKSTLLRMIAGLEEVTDGTHHDRRRATSPTSQPRQRDIAMVFQNYALYPHMTVRENLGFGLKLRKVAKAEMREQRVDEVATILGLETLLDRKPGALSGGQRQRVAMGRAMVREPKAFLMDEPLSNLDAKLRVSMRAELSRLHERLGVTTVYVTHDQVEAMTLGQRVAVMRDGLLQQVRHAAERSSTTRRTCSSPRSSARPSMNLVDAEVADGAVRFGSQTLALPPGSPMVNASRRVILGLRPTDFEHAVGADPALPRMRVRADVVEELGAETHIIFAVDAPRVSAEAVRAATEDEDGTLFADDQRAQFTARVDGRKRVLPGDDVDLAVDSGRFHFFEPETGVTLASGALAGAAL